MGLAEARQIMLPDDADATWEYRFLSAQTHALVSIAESLERLASCVRDEHVEKGSLDQDLTIRPYLRTRG